MGLKYGDPSDGPEPKTILAFCLPQDPLCHITTGMANTGNIKLTTGKLARMNLAICGIDANLGPPSADSFRQDLHRSSKADLILANPPFKMNDWDGENLRQDMRWKFGMPTVRNPFSPN